MPVKRAACDPCRRSKLACDHRRPCGRCHQKNLTTACTYRSAPFAKRASILLGRGQVSAAPQPSLYNSKSNPDHNLSTNVSNRYPNPGYLGQLSHTTIFGQLPSVVDRVEAGESSRVTLHSVSNTEQPLVEVELLHGKLLLDEMKNLVPVKLCIDLVNTWLIRGYNLALAGQFTSHFVRTMEVIFDAPNGEVQDTNELSTHLFLQSLKVIMLNKNSTLDDFTDQFCLGNARWETLGLFFTAVSMATIDLVRHPGLFVCSTQRQNLRRLAMRLADRCLTLTLTLDGLNDLQLLLMYENFINHTCTDGDQSFTSWKRLGDVISSIYALGYHELTRTGDKCPEFLGRIREAALAFTYSADKNMSIFLGRPPRMNRRYCDFELINQAIVRQYSNSDQSVSYIDQGTERPFDYLVEAWWSAMCAVHKEEVLEIFRERDETEKTRRASVIRFNVQQLWERLPSQFRLNGRLMTSSDLPIERDFLASARLNHLHVSFLLECSLSGHNSKLDSRLLTVSAEILDLVIQQNMISEYLVGSGTGLLWRTIYYGLPAAGTLCLALLNGIASAERPDVNVTNVLRNLDVLVVQVQAGGMIDSTNPNYALLIEAVGTVKTITDRILLRSTRDHSQHSLPLAQSDSATGAESVELWMPWDSGEVWDFDEPFWANLAEHPNLVPADDTQF